VAARSVTVFVNMNRFSPEPQYANSATHSLAQATDSTGELLGWALGTLERIYRPGYRYKKAGVYFSRLVPADKLTGRLFDDDPFERSRRLMSFVCRPARCCNHRSHHALKDSRLGDIAEGAPFALYSCARRYITI
jgi:DNA polymerase V